MLGEGEGFGGAGGVSCEGLAVVEDVVIWWLGETVDVYTAKEGMLGLLE